MTLRVAVARTADGWTFTFHGKHGPLSIEFICPNCLALAVADAIELDADSPAALYVATGSLVAPPKAEV